MALSDQTRKPRMLPDPPFMAALTADLRLAWLWLVIRIGLGWSWLTDGWSKSQQASWMDGAEIRGAWTSVATSSATSELHRSIMQFLLDHQADSWIARLIAIGERLFGIALLLGLLAGAVAFAGSLMSITTAVAGSGMVNPVTLGVAILIVLAWKTAGWIGFDRWLLPLLGAPWESRAMSRRPTPEPLRPTVTTEVFK